MVGRVVFFGRMLDKIRLHAQSCLPADYNRGVRLDERTCRFLHIDYEKLVSRVLQGGTDEEILEWCCQPGTSPKQGRDICLECIHDQAGWLDDVSEWLAEQKGSRGWEQRDDIQTAFDFHVADETES
jgi:hypothetical protein